MARIQDYYQNRRDLGPSAMTAYMDAWLGERASMNKALMAPKKGADPAKLAEQEARLRRALADLVKARATGETKEIEANSRLAEKLLGEVGRVTAANAGASATVRSAQIRAGSDARETQAKYRQRVADDLTLKDPDVKSVVGTGYKQSSSAQGGARGAGLVTRPDGGPGALSVLVEDMARTESGGGKDETSKRDAIVASLISQATAAGDTEAAKALSERFGEPGLTFDAYLAKTHPDYTQAELKAALDDSERIARKGGSGTAGLISLGESLIKQFPGRTVVGEKSSGTVPDDLDAQIKALGDAADDLARARDKAMETDRVFPRPNYMIANPNAYTDPRYVREAKAWGVLPAEYVDEVAGARERTGSWAGAVKEIGDRGGLSTQQLAVPAELLAEEDTAQVDDPATEWSQRVRKGEGGYTYTLNEDGTISVGKPDGKPGATVKPGSKEHAAIVDELYRVDAPDAVAGLYDPARVLASQGQWDKAAAQGFVVDPNAVRSGWAQAIREAADNPATLPTLIRQVGDKGGKWGEHLRALVDVPDTDRYAHARKFGAFRALADAMDAAPEIEAADRAQPSAARERASVQSGQFDTASEDYTAARQAAAALAAKIQGTPEERRAALNRYGSLFDATKGDYQRGMVDEINDQVQRTTAPTPMRDLPATSSDIAGRPSEGEALKLGVRPDSAKVRGADLALEPGGAADEDADFDAFLETTVKAKPDADTDFDAFLETQIKEK